MGTLEELTDSELGELESNICLKTLALINRKLNETEKCSLLFVKKKGTEL